MKTLMHTDPCCFGLWLDLAVLDIEACGTEPGGEEDKELAARFHAGQATWDDLRVLEDHALMLLSECWRQAELPRVWN
jgi:hypothetical protein